MLADDARNQGAQRCILREMHLKNEQVQRSWKREVVVAPSPSHTAFAPDHFANLAERYGHRPLFTVAWDGFCLQQYECSAGGWQHEPIGACRIAVQETGQPRVERAID